MDVLPTQPKSPPATRYQGSKFKLLPALQVYFEELEFTTALDAFSGTACVSYLLKNLGKQVTANDCLRSNRLVARALIENQNTVLDEDLIDRLIQPQPGVAYEDFIESTFEDIYFTSAENRWLDVVAQNIPRLEDRYQRAIAYYALFQACTAKRPYNLFHRRNLYMRTADVRRSFGNKSTWDAPFEELFRKFVAVANEAVHDSGVPCAAVCHDVHEFEGAFDLVYIDPPYINGKGVGVDYGDFYHFLEGLTDYPAWESRIDRSRKHLPMHRKGSPWTDPHRIHSAFAELFERFAAATLVVSYRSDGIPSIAELKEILQRFKSNVRVVRLGRYQYALSKNSQSNEILLIGQ